uniref:Uncharacterized protein n=1 Tax=Dromaius novaehollandiae TaxID=8790 RepID=A0A8C4K6N7_DRONO
MRTADSRNASARLVTELENRTVTSDIFCTEFCTAILLISLLLSARSNTLAFTLESSHLLASSCPDSCADLLFIMGAARGQNLDHPVRAHEMMLRVQKLNSEHYWHVRYNCCYCQELSECQNWSRG